MGRHRKPRHAQRRPSHSPRHPRLPRRSPYRLSRRIALLTAGVLIPCTGGAAVLASTHLQERAAPSAGVRRSVAQPSVRSRVPAAVRTTPPTAPDASAATTPARPAPGATASTPPAPPLTFSPYADVLTWPPLDLAKTAARTRVKDFTLGFVSAGGTGCAASWDGMTPLTDAVVRRLLGQVPGALTVAFGGPHGVEPAERCGTDQLAARYAAVLGATHAARLDFYLTDAELADAPANVRRTQALARLQHDHPGLRISFTLPVHRSGLSADALAALSAAADGGLAVATVGLAPAGGGTSALIASATAANAQLQRLYRQNAAAVWRRISLTPVIGVAATGAGFRPDDARRLRAWAAAHGLGGLSMWSLTRDAPCVADTSALADTCSGLDEDAGVFTAILGGS